MFVGHIYFPQLLPDPFPTNILPHGVQFVLLTYSCVWDHTLEHCLPARGHTLKDNSLPFPQKPPAVNNSYEVGACESLTTSMLE